MPKIATTTLNLSEYRMVDGFYLRNGFSLVQDKYCTETGLPIFVNKRANGKWGYCDNEGTDFYVKWIEEEEVECYGCGDTPCVKPADPMDTRFCESCAKIDAEIDLALDSDEEDVYNGSKDFPPNETDETCPICLEAYDREIRRLKDGIRNSDCESNCPHWCCCMCWDTMYREDNDTDYCPICKRDITDWLKTHYEDDEEEDDDEEDMGECPKCDCAVKRCDLAWRPGYYLDICRKCDEEEDNEEEEDSEFICELIDCATCKRPTMRKDMYWKEGGCCMTELCEPCHKAKIPDDMMVVPRYMFENEKGEKVKWVLCAMKL